MPQSKKSFRLSLLTVSSRAPKNHFCKYTSGSSMFAMHSAKSSRLASRERHGWMSSFGLEVLSVPEMNYHVEECLRSGPEFKQERRSEEHTSELQSLAYLVCR